MSNQLPLSSLSNFDRIIARSCMKNPNAKALTEEEISLFLKKKESICINIGDTFHKEQPDALYYENPAVKKSIIDTEVASLNDNNKAKEIQEISDMITTAVKSHKNSDISKIDVKYWAQKIYNISTKYNVPAALIVSIIEKETFFRKNITSGNGTGPMQMTTIAVQDFFPSNQGSWHDIYEMMDSELLNDILYTDFSHKKLRADNASDLRKLAGKDDELGMKMGVLTFEMNFVKAVAKHKFGKATLTTVKKTIQGLKNGTIKLSETQAKACVTAALKNYNSVFQTYAPQVVDSLQRMGIQFTEFNDIIKS
ncbi:hypothetical protein IKP85_04070 [bacterium]|nr:hypothetical protein [bacterium]